jgi:hypothetical protein
MSLIHLHNEIVHERELGARSWRAFISYSFDELSGEVIAETFMVHHNAVRPNEDYRKCRCRSPVNRELLPVLVARKLEEVESSAGRDTTVMETGKTTPWKSMAERRGDQD